VAVAQVQTSFQQKSGLHSVVVPVAKATSPAPLEEVKTGLVLRDLRNDEVVLLPVGTLVERTAGGIVRASATSFAAADGFLGAVWPRDIAPTRRDSVLTDGGAIDLPMVPGLTLTDGDRVFLSTTAGRGTTVPPSGSGHVVLDLGLVDDSSIYDSAAAAPVARVWLRRGITYVV
jgi:hypothetical protein